MPAHPASLSIRRGDPFRLALQLFDGVSRVSLPVAAVNTSAGTITISGDYTAWFVSGKLLRLSGNRLPEANKVYAVASSALSAGNTVVTVTGGLPSGTTATGSVARTADDPRDLSGWAVSSQIRTGPSADADLIAGFFVEETDLSAGSFALELSAAETAAITAARGWFDVKIDPGDGTPPLRTDPAGVVFKDVVTE